MTQSQMVDTKSNGGPKGQKVANPRSNILKP